MKSNESRVGVRVCNSNPDVFYYKAIDSESVTVLLFGEEGEQYTDYIVSYCNEQRVPLLLFPWAKVEELRLQLEIIRYPALQMWRSGNIIKELFGYSQENLKEFFDSYFRRRKRL